MKKITLLLLVFAVCSCQNKLELDGNWVIIEMAHYGEKVYPETISNEFRVEFNVDGYDGAEKVRFNAADSTVTFPGFKSDYLDLKFSMSTDSIHFKGFDGTSKEESHKLTKRTFLRDFEIVNESDNNYLRLNSDLTIIRMVKEEYLLEEKLDDFFNQLR
ncbi:hypothetical protein [Flagellimonas sp.]|uniref:hypothetical protein n=1 Tax=Flagellimonas sp. TaxID=2058762 RepID=UPI003F4A5C5A